MKNVLLIGESPLGCSGNSNMMRALLTQIDRQEYRVAVYGASTQSTLRLDLFKIPPFTFIPASSGQDKWGANALLEILQVHQIDLILFVGVDLWAYAMVFDKINQIQQIRHFKWGSIFPYDAVEIRQDWVRWVNMIQFPCVYSKYGFNLLKALCPRIRYFRPPLFLSKTFTPYDAETKLSMRRQYFPVLKDTDFLFGFVGNNQVRKDPQRILMAYAEIRHKRKDVYVYMHTEMEQGVYNLSQLAIDVGLKTGDLISKGPHQSKWVNPKMMVDIYNTFDCLVNASLQEGLSWTLLEAMLCGVPVIASDTTAQTELVKDVGILLPCKELTWMPVVGGKGQTWVKSTACKVSDIKKAMLTVVDSQALRTKCSERGVEKAKKWLEGVDNINGLLKEMATEGQAKVHLQRQAKLPMLLFAQHSSAGDVFMTTRCFKGLKERYRLPIVYMTQMQYMDIVQGNPYLEKVIEWDEEAPPDYLHYLNPHKDRILPGHWGRNCNSILSDFYWKILMVEPDDFYIDIQPPPDPILQEIEAAGDKPLAVVHTTGGDSFFRTYKYMADVCKGLADKYTTIQVGGPHDFPGWADIDCRGKLTWRQTAWVMKEAVVAVTIDSFLSHLAGAFGVSQVCLFGSGNVYVVRPNQLKGELVCLVPDYINDCPGLGPCSGVVRQCPVPCTGIHDPQKILSAIRSMEDNGMVRRSDEHSTASYRIEYA